MQDEVLGVSPAAVLSPGIRLGWGGSTLYGRSGRKGWAEAE